MIEIVEQRCPECNSLIEYRVVRDTFIGPHWCPYCSEVTSQHLIDIIREKIRTSTKGEDTK